jgi:hypothetical protein
MAKHESYDEDKIVSLWSEIFQLQQALEYYPSPDSIEHAPPEGHRINLDTCEKLKLSPRVISLMKRLSYPRDFDTAHDFPTFERSVAIPYTQDDQIVFARDPDTCFSLNDEEEVNTEFLRPAEIALVVCLDEGGFHLILDTDASR